MSYRLTEHTADIGLHVEARDLPGLFDQAGRALFSVFILNLEEVEGAQSRTIELSGQNMEDLLFDWLSELLFVFESEHLVLSRFDVDVDEQACAVRARGWGEPLDEARHRLGPEVKAVTYHHLRLARTAAGYELEAIVDV